MRRSVWNWLFLLSSLGSGLLFGVLVYQETFPEWAFTQADYYRRLAKVTGDPGKARTPLKVKQIHLPEFHRVDRCVTCHAGVDNPKMSNEPQPFRTHPDLGIQEFLPKHSFEEMGCTVCHHGQGPATTKVQAHGHVPHWEEPLLPRHLVVGTCAACHENIQGLRGAEKLVQAQALFKEMGCIGCHNLHGKGMLVGPELDETWHKGVDQFDFHHVRGKETVANWVEDHFRDPQRVVPGYPALGIPESAMPNYELTEEEVQILSALVLSFAAEKGKEGHPIPARFKVPGGVALPQPAFSSSVEKGGYLFQKYGCIACHGVGGLGGIRNKNMDVGEEVPSLLFVADGYTKEELKKVIRDGRTPARADPKDLAPPLWMPSWKDKIPEEELDAITDYLIALRPDSPAAK